MRFRAITPYARSVGPTFLACVWIRNWIVKVRPLIGILVAGIVAYPKYTFLVLKPVRGIFAFGPFQLVTNPLRFRVNKQVIMHRGDTRMISSYGIFFLPNDIRVKPGFAKNFVEHQLRSLRFVVIQRDP